MPETSGNILQEIEWGILRVPLIILLVVILAGTGWIYWSKSYLAQMQGSERIQQKKMTKAQKKWDETEQTLEILETFYKDFQVLRKRGFIGEDQHLIWDRQLRALEGNVDLPGLKYEILPKERKYKNDELELDENFHVYESELLLHMGLLHEGDLFKALDILRGAQLEESQRPPVILKPQKCVMTQVREKIIQNPTIPNIKTECTVLWYRVQIEEAPTKTR